MNLLNTLFNSTLVLGQGIKDIIKMPRPGPPVQKLQTKWALEYGMPSTHAMVAVSIPFSVLLYTMDRYQYSFSWGLSFALIWCSLICLSRVYLGMHSVLVSYSLFLFLRDLRHNLSFYYTDVLFLSY